MLYQLSYAPVRTTREFLLRNICDGDGAAAKIIT
jgi:hypothetical protein